MTDYCARCGAPIVLGVWGQWRHRLTGVRYCDALPPVVAVPLPEDDE